jgi:hypothetical protein
MPLFRKASDKCGVCKKYTCRCIRNPRGNEKKKEVITNKLGRKQTVTKNTGNQQDARGNVWCGKCSNRVVNGRCTYIRCVNH